MRLRRLEIKGFKSFGKETVIHFSESVTGIVGPNGSGKSNVVDAIRWVLGEQRTSGLRLEKMGDVLFNGTSKKKAANAASVSIVFENNKGLLPTEYHEVKITRMLYKSGHSEYKLNDVSCRLKDISNLLVDTGISSNSYAIIELGMIDDILADKENARRRMFEQAAGISKFKKRKRETQLKLDATNADLERVDDLLHEIKANLKELEKQARKARRFLSIKEKYKEVSIQEAVLSLQQIKAKHESLKEKIGQAQDEYQKITSNLRQAEANLENEKAANLHKGDALTDLQKQLNELINTIRGHEHDIKLAEQEIGFSRRKIETASERIEEEGTTSVTLGEEITQMQSRFDNMQESLQVSEAELTKHKDAREQEAEKHATHQSAHQGLLDQQIEVEKVLFELEKRKALIGNDMVNNDSQVGRLKDEYDDLNARLTDLRNQRLEMDETLVSKRAHVDAMNADIQAQQEIQKTLENRLSEIRSEQSKVGRILDARKNEFQLTKSMVENLEGYPNSIKFLSKQSQWKRQATLFSDVLAVNDTYKAAIERFLEPYLNYYVVEDDLQAMEGVSLLKDAQKGRAHFFVLEHFKSDSNKAKKIDGLIPARDAVDVQTPYDHLVYSLLENVYIAENEISRDKLEHRDITIVASDGHVIHAPKLVSGGSVGLFDGKKIGRKKNLDALQKEISKLERQYDQLTKSKIEVKNDLSMMEEKALDEVLDQYRRELQELELNRARLVSQEDAVQQQMTNNHDLRTSLIEKKAALHQEEVENSAKYESLSKEYYELKNEISGISDQLKMSSEALSGASQHFNTFHVEHIKLQNTLQALKREIDYKQDRLNNINVSIQRSKEEVVSARAMIDSNTEKIADWKTKTADAYASRQKLEGELSEKETEFFKARDIIHRLEKEITQLNSSHRQQQSLINDLKDSFNEVKYKMQNVGQRVQMEFNIGIQDLLKMEVPEELEIESLREQMEKLRNRIFNFGEVNSLAVEAHAEMEERYQGIQEQRDDILEAQASLEQTIIELEESATRKFIEAFDAVRDHFQHIFRSLFREGDACDLILLDPENPLESKVEIIAKPKGKRPVTLSQLSGGEKTLTATALLFALYLLKPAPFCVFDEVDAPLDDANIFKFNNIIRDFSGDSQFVIITHNKLTMAEVDVIYGVYMDEPGISSVTPVDFRQFEHEPLPVEIVG